MAITQFRQGDQETLYDAWDLYEEYGDKSDQFGSISEKCGNSNETIGSIFERNLLKSFPSDIEKNHKQCMAVTLRSGKELDKPKKLKEDEKQVNQKNLEA